MPPQSQSAALPAKTKAPIAVQIVAALFALSAALGAFAIGTGFLTGFDPIHLVSLILALAILIGAFGLFSAKRWALYTVSVGEIIAMVISLAGGVNILSLLPLVLLAICWYHRKSFV